MRWDSFPRELYTASVLMKLWECSCMIASDEHVQLTAASLVQCHFVTSHGVPQNLYRIPGTTKRKLLCLQQTLYVLCPCLYFVCLSCRNKILTIIGTKQFRSYPCYLTGGDTRDLCVICLGVEQKVSSQGADCAHCNCLLMRDSAPTLPSLRRVARLVALRRRS